MISELVSQVYKWMLLLMLRYNQSAFSKMMWEESFVKESIVS